MPDPPADASAPSVPPTRPQGDPLPRGPWRVLVTLGLFAVLLAAFTLVQSFAVLAVGTLAPPGLAGPGTQVSGELPGGQPAEWHAYGLAVSVATLASALVCIPLVFGVVRLRRGPPIRECLGLFPTTAGSVIHWLGIIAIFSVVYELVMLGLGRSAVPPFVLEAYRTADPLFLLWFAVVVAAPVSEELLFRGFLLGDLSRSQVGPAGACVVSAFLFASVHLQYDAIDLAAVGVLGLLLALARLRTGSIYTSMFMHSAVNLIAMIETAITAASG